MAVKNKKNNNYKKNSAINAEFFHSFYLKYNNQL